MTAAGTYALEARIASSGAGGTFHIEFNGVNKTGPISIPNTGHWGIWQTISLPNVTLSAGQQVMRVVMDTESAANGGFVGDFDCFRIVHLEAVSPTAFVRERLDPRNRTGGSGVDLLSGNFNWNMPLVALPGRAGHDLGLALSYNSLVWTKSANGASIKFDEDGGYPAPGFRLGFPVISGQTFMSEAGVSAYLLIMPSGARVELRQVSASVYESADSSYMQLTVNADGTLTLRPTSGARLTYARRGTDFRCVEVRDTNGNLITAEYDSQGRLTKITDTVARVINFNYTGTDLTSITQPRGAATHKWAEFVYEVRSIQPSFSGITNIIAPQSMRALKRVKYPDGSSYEFSYNSWGQVSAITCLGESDRFLNSTSYNLPTGGTPVGDCPRFNERQDRAESWNGGLAVKTNYVIATDANNTGEVKTPDGTVHRETFGTGWQKGLVIETKTFSSDNLTTPKRRVVVTWRQDNESAGINFWTNPRVVETNTYDDAGGRRRTTISHTRFGLPEDVREFGTDGVSVLRRTQTVYKIENGADDDYLNRRVIGLAREQRVYDAKGDANHALISHIELEYDEGGELFVNQGTASQHVDVGYLRGRGNQTTVWRVNVNNATDRVAIMRSGYNTHGSIIFHKDTILK